MMKSLIKIFISLTVIVGSCSFSMKAQTTITISDLFASESYLFNDTVNEKAQVFISFLISRPDQAARVEFKIGENIDTGEVFMGTATIEKRGDKYYSVFNGDAVKLQGDKVSIYYTGDRARFYDAKYVTVRVQALNGTISERAFCFVRYFKKSGS